MMPASDIKTLVPCSCWDPIPPVPLCATSAQIHRWKQGEQF